MATDIQKGNFMTLTGQKIDGYIFKDQIGVGSTGDIYEAFDTTAQRTVIIKVLQEQYSDTSEYVQRFLREIRIVETLDHPNIIPVYGHGIYNDLVYLVMKWIDGTNLEMALQNKPFTPALVQIILNPLASALTEAHQQRILHRDIKPANILLEDQGGNIHVYLSDFGMGKQIKLDPNLTDTGAVIGSPAYTSPEAVNGEELTELSDLYSVGIMTYEMLTGKLPFANSFPYLLMLAHIRQAPPPMTSHHPDFPPELEAVVMRSLAKNPADRFASVQDFVDAYNHAMSKLSQQQQDTGYWSL